MEDRKNTVHKYYVPLLVEESVLPADAKAEDFAIRYVDGKKKLVYLVPTTKEVYAAYTNAGEALRKKKNRHSLYNTDNIYKFIPLSLDDLIDDDDFDIPDPTDQFEIATLTWLIRDAIEIIRKKKPHYAQFLELFNQDFTEREIAQKMKCSRNTIKDIKPYALAYLKKLLEK